MGKVVIFKDTGLLRHYTPRKDVKYRSKATYVKTPKDIKEGQKA